MQDDLRQPIMPIKTVSTKRKCPNAHNRQYKAFTRFSRENTISYSEIFELLKL